MQFFVGFILIMSGATLIMFLLQNLFHAFGIITGGLILAVLLWYANDRGWL